MHLLSTLTFSVSYWVWFAYCVCVGWDTIIRLWWPRAAQVMIAFGNELRPFTLAAVIGQHLGDVALAHDPWNVMRLFWTGVNLLIWWLFRNRHDDRWNKRRRKLAEKVQQIGGKLVITPQPS
jgi:Flp pilus assembly protein TadB